MNCRMIVVLLLFLAAFSQADEKKYDVVVYGGVPCGISASITAAREKASVILIEPTKHVGGLSTSGINTAESEHMLKWTFGGFALEFYERLGKHYGSNRAEYYFESSAAEKVYLEMLKEAGVPVHYGASVDKVEKDGSVITTIKLTDGTLIKGSVFNRVFIAETITALATAFSDELGNGNLRDLISANQLNTIFKVLLNEVAKNPDVLLGENSSVGEKAVLTQVLTSITASFGSNL